MENSQKKRSRALNFSSNEKEVLFSLVLKYKDIVENKKTDQVSVGEKMEAWHKIGQEFNALSPNLCVRSTDSLKKFFENKKKEVRKQVAEEKKEIFVTGGGTKKDVKGDPNQDLLLSIMNTKTVFGLENCFDSDNNTYLEQDAEFEVEANYEESQMNVGDCEENLSREEFTLKENSEDFQSQSSKEQWKKACSLKKPLTENLKRPHNIIDNEMPSTSKTTLLSSSRRRPKTTVRALSSSNLAEKYEVLLDKRLLIADYEKRKLENDIQMQREEHNLRMELLKTQLEVEKKKLKSFL